MNITPLLVVGFLFIAGCQAPQKEKSENQKTEIKELPENPRMDLLNQKIRKDITNPDLYVKRAQLYDSLGDAQGAVQDLDRAFRLDTTRMETLLAQAEFLAKKGKVDISLGLLEKAKRYHPEADEVYVKFSEVFLMVGDNEKSLKNADLAVKYNMFNAEAYYLKGYNFLELKDTNKAISSYQTAVEQDPNHFNAYLELGVIYSEKGDPLALDYFRNALEIKPRDRNVLYAKGMFEQEHEMYNEAIDTYFKATKADPDFREAHYNLGYVHLFYLKLYREAVGYFTDAIEADPNYHEAYYNRGYSFELMGDIHNAAKDYRKALSIKPDYELAAKGLSRVTEGV